MYITSDILTMDVGGNSMRNNKFDFTSMACDGFSFVQSETS